jgi:cytochrome c oxidase assembly factor CtaG
MVGTLCLVAGIGYWIAGRRPVRLWGVRPRWTRRAWRTTAFLSALLLIALLCGPLDAAVRQNFWMQTAGMMALLMLAGPLLVLGAPGARLSRRFHRGPASALGRWRSISAFALFTSTLIVVYLPAVYRLTAPDGLMRKAAQVGIVLVGYAFWAQVIAQPGRPCALSQIGRVAYLFLSSVQVRILGLVLGFAPHSFYPVPLVDQQIAAGILMVPGVLSDLIVLTVCLYLWLAQDERRHLGGSDRGGRLVSLAG